MTIKVGDKVKQILPAKNNKRPFTAIVVDVTPCNPDNPIEEHGFVEIKIIDPGTKLQYLKVDDLEHYGHSNWMNSLKIINES